MDAILRIFDNFIEKSKISSVKEVLPCGIRGFLDYQK